MSMKPHNPLTEREVQQLDSLLADLRERNEHTPDLEQLDGFLTAVVCSPRSLSIEDFLPVLFSDPDAPDHKAVLPFADAQEQADFEQWVVRRAQDVQTCLHAPVEELQDPKALNPYLNDWAQIAAELTPQEKAQLEKEALVIGSPVWPELGAFWAAGFLHVVDHWAEDWSIEDDEDAQAILDDCLQVIEALTLGHDELSDEERALSRDELVGRAIWAVYDLRDLWRERPAKRAQKPRRVAQKPERNDACYCGSGKKYKHCHGAN
jgi:uncharacterized protein